MNKKEALTLIEQYIKGWKQNDFGLIASTVHEQCKIIESHGPTYYGVKDLKLWFNLWIAANSKIIKWDLVSDYYCADDNAVFIEWEFECLSNGISYSLSGTSIIKFCDEKISFIHEYRMTRPAFDWDKKKLISD